MGSIVAKLVSVSLIAAVLILASMLLLTGR